MGTMLSLGRMGVVGPIQALSEPRRKDTFLIKSLICSPPSLQAKETPLLKPHGHCCHCRERWQQFGVRMVLPHPHASGWMHTSVGLEPVGVDLAAQQCHHPLLGQGDKVPVPHRSPSKPG